MIECTTIYGERKMIPKEKLVFRPCAYAIVIDKNKILLVNSKSTGKYWFPGGGIELGETLENGLKREAKEETGIEIEIGRYLYFKENFFYYNPLDEGYHCFYFFYFCHPKSLDLIDDEKVDDLESEKPRWVEIKSLKNEDFQLGVQEILEMIQK